MDSFRKRVLLVNCYFDDSHRGVRRPWKIPHAKGPVYLAGALAAPVCEVRLYDEVSSGPLHDEHLLAWPDMLVLTGLTNSFDRMLHLTAYARTKNRKAIVVAGGPAIRALPRLAGRVFDYACLGDVEQLREVIGDAFGPGFAADEMLPRYDLASWMGRVGHVETSRYCNFRCAFCALTAEGRRYQTYPLEAIARQIRSLPTTHHILFIDNNFYGNDRDDFLRRVALIKELREGGLLGDWAALVTSDFFSRSENLELVREAGCRAFFSGVESFDPGWLRDANKKQNTSGVQILSVLSGGALLCAGRLATGGLGAGLPSARRRTYVTTTEPLDSVYTPAFRIASRWEPYFEPTMITDESGAVTDAIADSGLLDEHPLRERRIGYAPTHAPNR